MSLSSTNIRLNAHSNHCLSVSFQIRSGQLSAHSRRGLEVDWMDMLVRVSVLVEAIEAAISVKHAIELAGLLIWLWGVHWCGVVVVRLVEGLCVPPVGVRLL